MFKEITVTLPIGKNHDSTMEFDVDLDVATEKAIDVYTDKRNYEDMPAVLKKLNWRAKQNSGFIHADNPSKAWEYLKEKAFYDLDED